MQARYKEMIAWSAPVRDFGTGLIVSSNFGCNRRSQDLRGVWRYLRSAGTRNIATKLVTI